MSAGKNVFVGPMVRREQRRYRRRGPTRTTRLLVEALREHGVEGATLLDIGGGVGAVQQELLSAGVERVVGVDAAPAYVEAARDEAARRGTLGRVRLLCGDFVDLAPELAPEDV
ncbi:MAG TPA: class I SAM-dependent methyltransferase, partial [Longimicrobiales bacterium]|nr:class I SAM-dependent methyltransferase [Longimicrobiales bacterium]